MSLIPKDMQASQFMDAIQEVTGLYAPGQRAGSPLTTEEKMRKARQIKQSIQAYVERPITKYKKFKEEIQATWKSSDLPDPVTDSFSKFEDISNFDVAWMDAFVDASNRIEPGRSYWEVLTDNTDTNAGDGKFGWKIIPEGHKVDLVKVTGSLTQIEVKKFGSGIEWTDELIRFRRIGPMLDIAEKFRRGYQTDKADNFYSLLANAIGATDERTEGATTLENDINALNYSAFKALDSVKNTRNLPAGHELLFYVSPLYKARINRALGEVSQAFSGSTARIEYNIRPIYTFNSNITGLTPSSGFDAAGLMVIPGYKNQFGQLMDVTMYDEMDILSLSYIQTAFAYYGGAVLDTNQIRKVNLV